MVYAEETALRALLSSSPDFIFFHDCEGRYRYVSEAAAAVFRRRPEEMIGLTTDDLGIPQETSARFHEQRRQVMASGRALRDEATYESAGGTLYLDYVIAPVIAGGESLGVVVVTRENGARHRADVALRESEAKFSTAFGRSPLALTITSMIDGTLVEVNEGFVRLSGYTRDEAIGHTPEELGLWVDPQVRAERFALLREGKAVPEIEARFRVKSGDILIGYIGSAVVEINGRPCVLSSVVDITERKRAEEAKDAFLATLSHELRTPLTAAYGWVKLLAKMRDPELLESGLRAIEESVVTQIRLIDDLLDVSRIAVGKMHIDLQPLDLGAVIDGAVEMIRPQAESKNIELRVHAHPVLPILGDAARLKQVVWNLLSNAIKFTPRNGAVDLQIRKAGEHAEVIISDSGEGIDPKFLPHVFDRFRQADSSISRRHGGLGIGLSIVASVVEAHNGTVRAESGGAGQGSTFFVAIPLIERPPAEPRLPVAQRGGGETLSGARVLVVDDDEATRSIVTSALRAAGADVCECDTARAAFDAVTQWHPSVVISDLAMPDEDGYSLIRRLRQSGHAVPAVAMTAYVRSEDEARMREAGFQSRIAKPFDPDELVRTVRELG